MLSVLLQWQTRVPWALTGERCWEDAAPESLSALGWIQPSCVREQTKKEPKPKVIQPEVWGRIRGAGAALAGMIIKSCIPSCQQSRVCEPEVWEELNWEIYHGHFPLDGWDETIFTLAGEDCSGVCGVLQPLPTDQHPQIFRLLSSIFPCIGLIH